jgi:hypothetical protein
MNKFFIHVVLPCLLIPLVTTQCLALGQIQDDNKLPNATITMDYQAGVQVESDQLGEFVSRSLNVEFGNADIEEVSYQLRVEVLSREKSVTAAYYSLITDCLPRQDYAGSTWIRDPQEMNEQLEAEFDGRHKITVGKTMVVNHEEQYVARECGDATHALQITLMPVDRPASHLPTGKRQVCLNVEH